MKKITLFLIAIATMFLTIHTFAQDNPSNAATLLNVPQEFVKYNGQIQKKIQYDLTEYRTIDFTNVDTINGKLVKKIDTTYTYGSVIGKTEDFGHYALNMIGHYLNSYGYTQLSDSRLTKPAKWATVPIGQFAGETYYHGLSNVDIIPTGSGYNFQVISYPYMNTEKNGLPAITPWMSIKRVDISIVGNVSVSQPRFQVKITNVRKNTGQPYSVDYTKQQLESRSKLTESQIGEMTKTIWQIFPTSGNTHGNSIATSIQRTGNVYKGISYINGIDIVNLNYKNLMAPFFQKYGGYVNRWRLNNGEVNVGSLGATWMTQLESNESTELIIVAGSAFSYNESTNTLTYNANLPAELIWQTEFKPAQGKQTSVETRINLATGEVIWK